MKLGTCCDLTQNNMDSRQYAGMNFKWPPAGRHTAGWVDSLVGWLRVGDECGVDVVNLLVDDCLRCPKQSPLVLQGKR